MLCAPLVAGCGAATRVDFSPHSRPASPLEISVVANADQQLLVDPSAISPGPVLFNVLNLSRRTVRFYVGAHGRLLVGTPALAPEATAQVKALVGPGDIIRDVSESSPSSTPGGVALTVAGRARTGDSELTQP